MWPTNSGSTAKIRQCNGSAARPARQHPKFAKELRATKRRLLARQLPMLKAKRNASPGQRRRTIALAWLPMNDDEQRALCVYSVNHRAGKDRDWIKIGSALPHLDGKGFDITLEALPVNARLI